MLLSVLYSILLTLIPSFSVLAATSTVVSVDPGSAAMCAGRGEPGSTIVWRWRGSTTSERILS